ncbi:MAG: NAD(P)H-hydrate epimerase [Rhodobacteraceae bacterium]|nr:NAD(P)H-hydrate epimerase [Paracoccaceae bacterium]
MATDEFGFPLGQGWPAIDARGMTEVDLLMVHSYGITLPQMMENAGLLLATLARARFLGGNAEGRRVVVLAGAGGNGGGALTAARRLASWGAEVTLVLAQEPSALTPVPALQLGILREMGLHPAEVPDIPPDLIIDGLVGYSLRGDPRGRAAELIGWANASPAPVLALDVPSGFDAASGALRAPAMTADATLTLALPKAGLAQCPATGALYLADISVPPALYARLSVPLAVPGFGQGTILRLVEA